MEIGLIYWEKKGYIPVLIKALSQELKKTPNFMSHPHLQNLDFNTYLFPQSTMECQ